MYMALASKQVDGYSGSTRLHCDLCDAINLMVYSIPAQGTALWHIFKVCDVPKIRAYIQDAFNHPREDDPIHSQRYYLGPSNLAELKNVHGVVPFTIHQAVGEAVFIPAGCPHQVSFRLWMYIMVLTFSFCNPLPRSAMRRTVSKLLPTSCRLMHLPHVKLLLENFDSLICKTHGKMMFCSSMRSYTMHICLCNAH